ncbi:DUF1465 family protein [Govanella unica]|uniref:DUF1465 family protein n=1 Tax=Govanella unica TaxID=2975056 RepID=A0A9X3U024_9PROT|nr:DUF1465 family protein [Govania unica]MDA5194890.1 DUF1465 family protein [Govania unica]
MTQSLPHTGHPDAPFLERAFGEAMILVQQTACYLEHDGVADRDRLAESGRTVFTGEALRVTTRLMQAVAWLLVHRAVAQGEMTADEGLSPGRRLGGREICLGPAMSGAEALPDRLRELLGASRQIYERVARLEDRLMDGIGQDNPVHDLLRRLDS